MAADHLVGIRGLLLLLLGLLGLFLGLGLDVGLGLGHGTGPLDCLTGWLPVPLNMGLDVRG